MHIKNLQLLLFIKLTSTVEINIKISENKVYNKTEHLNYKYIQKLCNDTEVVCKSNHTNVCAVRKVNGGYEHRDFENSCFLTLNNICLYFENEFAIAQIGNCHDYLKARRSSEYLDPTKENEALLNNDPNDDNSTDTTPEPDADKDAITNTTKPALRKFSFSTLYVVQEAFDGHICPHSCPNVYSPICLSANRGSGKYFKMWTFINHCLGDIYYCKNSEEFAPPPDEDYEDVNDSPITWSYCGAARFTAFARGSEDMSSMSRYGWLHGDQRFNKILQPWERKPGYGR